MEKRITKKEEVAMQNKQRSTIEVDKQKEDGQNPLPEVAAKHKTGAENNSIDERLLVALHVADEKKAQDTVVLDLRLVASFTDFFVITSGANPRQVQAIADDVSFRLKRMGTPVLRTEGYNTAEWVLLDFGDFVMHVFDLKARGFFDLERLWRDAVRLNLSAEEIKETGERVIAAQEAEYALRKSEA